VIYLLGTYLLFGQDFGCMLSIWLVYCLQKCETANTTTTLGSNSQLKTTKNTCET